MYILPMVVVMEVFSFFVRPVSHSVRLFANMLAGHITLQVFAGFIIMLGAAGVLGTLDAVLPFALTIALTALELLVSVLQAYVFAILTCIYLNDALHPGPSSSKVERGIDPATPPLQMVVGHRRQLERQSFPIGVEHPVEQKAGEQAPQREGEGVRVVAPVRAFERHPVPLDGRPVKELIKAERRHFRHDVTAVAKSDERFHESMDIDMPRQQTPVEPADIGVLTVRIIVAPLGSAHLVAHEQHRCAGRQELEADFRVPGVNQAAPPPGPQATFGQRQPLGRAP
jgi:hypothetical protein